LTNGGLTFEQSKSPSQKSRSIATVLEKGRDVKKLDGKEITVTARSAIDCAKPAKEEERE